MDKHTPGPIEKGYELTEKGYLGPSIPETTAQDTGPWEILKIVEAEHAEMLALLGDLRDMLNQVNEGDVVETSIPALFNWQSDRVRALLARIEGK